MLQGRSSRLLLLLTLFVQASVAQAQPREIPGYEGLAREVIERALRTYHSARTYQDDVTIEIEQHRADGRLTPAQPQPASLSFAAPDRILLETPVVDLYGDGEKLRIFAHGINQYRECDAPPRIDFDREPLVGWGFYELAHPIAWLIGRPAAAQTELLSSVERFGEAKTEELDGRPGHRVRGRVRLPFLPTLNNVASFDAWLSVETGLLEQLNVDLTQAWQELGPQLGPQVLVQYTIRFRFDKIRLDREFPSDHFVFKPAHEPQKVTSFEMPMGPRMESLLNTRAAGFRAVAVDENLLALVESREHTAPLTLMGPEDHRGRVLLLMLWKPSCIPCVSALSDVQRLTDEFRGRPITVVGVLGGEAMGIGAIHRYLEGQRIFIPHLFDAYNSVFGQLRPTTFPTFILLDHESVIRDALEGYLPGQEQRLRTMVEKGLADSERRREEEKVAATTTVERFLAAAAAGNETAAAGLVWPAKLPIDQLVQLRPKIDTSRLQVSAAFKNDSEGLVIAVAEARGGKPAQQVVFDLTRVNLAWLISGIEVSDGTAVQRRLGEFLERHPGAQPEQPAATTRPERSVTTVPAQVARDTRPAESTQR